MQPSPATNWLDRAINWVSPNLGLRRMRARALQSVLLGYEGVLSSRRQGGWNTTGASGNAEIGTGLRKLRENARDLCRNDAYAQKAKREWAKRVVGTGITPRPNTGADRVDRILAEKWEQWAAQCCSDQRVNFYAAEQLIVSSCYETGEVLVRLWPRRPSDGLDVPFQIQILEGDYLDTDKVQSMASGRIIHGVEYDPIGRIRGYWLYNDHPGEVTHNVFGRGLLSKFVPAEFVLHHAEFNRPGDARAVTRLAAAIRKLHDLHEYSDAEIMRKKIAACLTGILTQPEGEAGPTVGPLATDSEGKKIEEFRPGQFLYGSPGVNVEFFAPPDSGDYAKHKKAELQEIAAALEIPYVVLNDDLEAVNYSSYRGGLLAFRDAIEAYRWNWLIPQVLTPIYRRFVDMVFVLGLIPDANYSVEWDPPQFDLLDRGAEAEADRMELQVGASTWPQVVSRRGYDPNAQVSEIAKYRPMLEAAGVSFARSTSTSETQAGDSA